METAALLVVLASVGGFIVVRTVFQDQRRPARRQASPDRELAPATAPVPGTTPAVPTESHGRSGGASRSRRLLTTAALTDTLAIDGEEELRPSFFGRTLAFGRLLLVILFICALAGGTLFVVAMMIATKAHIHPG
jgi:hypothetical protein